MIPSSANNSLTEIHYHIYSRNREYDIVYDKKLRKWLGACLAFGQWYNISRRDCLNVLEQVGLKTQELFMNEPIKFCPLHVVKV